MPQQKSLSFTDLAGFQPKQLEAWFKLLEPETKYLLYGGAVSGGKSYFLRWACIGLGMYYFIKYGVRGIPIGLFSEDYPTLKDRQITKMAFEIPPYIGKIQESTTQGFVFRATPAYGEFVILLRNLDDPSKYQSSEFAAIAVEELTRNPDNVFSDLRTRLRYPGIEGDVKFLSASNPGGPSHALVKKLFINPDPYDPDPEQSRFVYVPARYSDNKYIPKDYVNQLMSLPEQMRKAYMEGSWDIFAGQYFSIWSEPKHIIMPFMPGKDELIVGGLDWGRVDNFSFHLARVQRVDMDGKHFYRTKVFYECYGKERTPKEWSEKIIKEIKRDFNITLDDVSWIRADTQIWAKALDGSALDIFTQFVQANPKWRKLRPANKDRVGGWENMQQWLKFAPDDTPYLQFSTDVKNAIRVIPSLVHDENKIEDISQKGENDAADSCFISGTQITTNRGLIDIENIKVGNKVLTRKGYRKVIAAGITGTKQVYQIKFSNGEKLIGTGNHPIWVNGEGFKPLDTLRYGDIMQTCTQTNIEQLLEEFGEKHLGKFQKGITFTIKTTTNLIIILKTLPVYLSLNIFPITANSSHQNLSIWQRLENLLINGMVQKKEKIGIKNMLRRVFLKNQMWNLPVNNVQKSLLQKVQERINFVPTAVKVSGEEKAEWIMRQEFVQSARRFLSVIGMLSQKPVQEPVLVVSLVKLKNKEIVYNLTVEDVPEYYANGVLVHNCRYMMMALKWIDAGSGAIYQQTETPKAVSAAKFIGEKQVSIDTDKFMDPEDDGEEFGRVFHR